MKRLLVVALTLVVALSAFAVGPQVGNFHAQNGYDNRDMALTVIVSITGTGVLWLNAQYSYPFLASERDTLAELLQSAQKKINIAIENKSTISYEQEVGGFFTETATFVMVGFVTQGYESTYTVVHIRYLGDDTILLLNKKDTQDFLTALGNARSYVADYDRQVALFR